MDIEKAKAIFTLSEAVKADTSAIDDFSQRDGTGWAIDVAGFRQRTPVSMTLEGELLSEHRYAVESVMTRMVMAALDAGFLPVVDDTAPSGE